MATERLKFTVAYMGGAFRGWQSQASGDAVQDLLEKAFYNLCGKRIVVHGSGRTDAGVHALAQIAHVEVERGFMPVRKWRLAINAYLPPEVRVLKLQRAAPDFHARFSARGKVYRYRIWNDPVLNPFEIGRVWHVPGKLDLNILRQCAAMLAGTHDFGAFAANRGTPVESTVRTLYSVKVASKGPLITVRFEGNGFLYKMVRLMTGTMVRCAQGRAPVSRIAELLNANGKFKTSFVARAEGLFLERVLY